MKKISEHLYVIEPGIYADREQGDWRISDESSVTLAGPFSSLTELCKHLEGQAAEDTANDIRDGFPEAADLVTLSEAAPFLPVSRQNLTMARKRGTLGVPPVVTGRTTTLYSLKALKERYPK